MTTTEVRGTNNGLVHPRGAVGIVARTPAGAEVNYLIRFPDGFETSFTREQFEILKHFKDRLPPSDAVSQFLPALPRRATRSLRFLLTFCSILGPRSPRSSVSTRDIRG